MAAKKITGRRSTAGAMDVDAALRLKRRADGM